MGSVSLLERRIRTTVEHLRQELSSLLVRVFGDPRRPNDLVCRAGINRSLASNLLRSIRAADALEAAHLMPGPEALRCVLAVARQKGADDCLISRVGQAVHEFEQLVVHELGALGGLQAVLSESLPEARRRLEAKSKQAIFTGFANIRGVSADVYSVTYLGHPSRDAGRVDLAMIIGFAGLRRTRPGAVLRVSSRNLGPQLEYDQRLTLDGQSVHGLDGLVLGDYCSQPVPPVKAFRSGPTVEYVVANDAFGPDSAINLVFGELCIGVLPRFQRPGERRSSGVAAEIEQPAKLLVFDFLLHKEVWRECVPELRVYDTVVRGTAHPNDPARDADRLDLSESIELVERGPRGTRIGSIPNYPELLRDACSKLNWDIESFRVYRCRVQYPVYGSQVCMVFYPPEAGS